MIAPRWKSTCGRSARAGSAASIAAALVMGCGAPSAAPPDYAVKFLCGTVAAAATAPLAPGTYATAINVHNPGVDTQFNLAARLAAPASPGPSPTDVPVNLEADKAIEIDCRIIRARLRIHADDAFATGFVIIKARHGMNVVAVYSARPENGAVSSIHTERVPRQEH